MDTQTCSNCGTTVRRGAKFCSTCGAPMVTPDQQAQPTVIHDNKQAAPTAFFPTPPSQRRSWIVALGIGGAIVALLLVGLCVVFVLRMPPVIGLQGSLGMQTQTAQAQTGGAATALAATARIENGPVETARAQDRATMEARTAAALRQTAALAITQTAGAQRVATQAALVRVTATQLALARSVATQTALAQIAEAPTATPTVQATATQPARLVFNASIFENPVDGNIRCGSQFSSAIWGRVRNSQGRPISGAMIRVVSRDGKHSYPARTNGRGEFKIPGLGCTTWIVQLVSVPNAAITPRSVSIGNINGGQYTGAGVEFRQR